MTPPRLKTEIWVAAYLKRANAAHRPAVLVRRGDATAGAVLIRVDRGDGTATVLSPSYDLGGARVWIRATGPDPVPWADSAAYVARQAARDPDLWLIDIEARDGEAMLDDPVV